MDRKTAILVFAIGLGFVVIGMLLLAAGDPKDRMMAMASVAFFGVVAMVGAMELFPTRLPRADADGVVTISASRPRGAMFAVAGLVFAVMGGVVAPAAWNEGKTITAVIAGLGVPFGLLVAAIAGRMAVSPTALYRIGPEGVEWMTGPRYRLAWRDVAQARILRSRSVRMIELIPVPGADPQPGLARKLNRGLGVEGLIVTPGVSGIRFDDLFALIQPWLERDEPDDYTQDDPE